MSTNKELLITKKAAEHLGLFFQLLKERINNGLICQKFVLQCMLLFWYENLGFLPAKLLINSINQALITGNNAEIFSNLSQQLNKLQIKGFLAIISPLHLTIYELQLLKICSDFDWNYINFTIFGNIFEQAIASKKRHQYGIHFTTEADIMKIVRPTISKYWEAKAESATTVKELSQLQVELANYKVLDPACGSGNFLYVAYQELKRIEQILLEKISENKSQILMSFVTPNQFFGMDINPFAVELAKVTLMIARKVAIDRYNLTESPLPLDSLDNNIVCQDALFSDWIKADAIIGNPPFLGGHRIRTELGDEYAKNVFTKFSEVKDKVDFCIYWFRLAHDNINDKGRVGLVGTNSISQGLSRTASLDYITNNNGYIHDAISSQEWSGQAAVFVSIVNWTKEKPTAYFLDNKQVNSVNSSLTSLTDVSQAKKLKVNANTCFKGVQPTGKGFILTEVQAKKWLDQDSKNHDIIKPFLGANDLAKNPLGKPERWIIDFNTMSLEEAANYQLPFQYIKENVKPERDKNKDQKTKEYWWQFPRTRPEMRDKINNLPYYFCIPRVSKWFIFLPAKKEWLPGDSTVIVALDDFYILGILTSKIHRLWIESQCSTLGETIRYTHNTCFETFPFPTPLSDPPQPCLVRGEQGGIVEKIRETMVNLHEYRSEQMLAKQWGITQLYNQFFHEPTSKLAKLHHELDNLVMQVYGFQSSDDILAKLLEMNLG